ncbi:helix-turn-helix domain-containing protein [Marinococcus halophilus]|uniref:Putative HTH-type transcriptional regulator YdeC n=1 Tax=Marinococcus halophilus TaxID=1371 RepID=A0A510YAG5_MARHA|nr:AraC family transcriptional regulator [Marinococcus halophilus]GEK60350.1 putative HTH-type transcriptional regulator YdeC [Marinococcus halophilus]
MGQNTIAINQQFQEITEQRSGALPVQYYLTAFHALVDGRLPWHWHDEVQWVVMLQGEAEFYINNDSCTVKQGEALFINSGRLHAAHHGVLPSEYLCINVDPSFLIPEALHETYLTPFITATNFSWIRIPAESLWGKTIMRSLLSLQHLLEEKPFHFELQAFTVLNNVWRHTIGHEPILTYHPAQEREEQAMKQMLGWIQRHYAESLRLEDIAQAGSLSRSECCRYFQRILQTTPMSYVKEYRLQKSMELLQASKTSVTDIAFQVGFSSASHFIEPFVGISI